MVPNISVIVATVGRPSLRQAIGSVEKQNLADIEIVVVAAGPGLAPVDSSLCVVNWIPADETLHRCAAANLGLEAARGRYLAFLDENGRFESGHLKRLLDALEASPEAVVAHAGIRSIPETGGPPTDFDAPFEPWQLMAAPRTSIHAALIRRAAVIAGPCRFDARLDAYADWDFWLQLQRMGTFIHVPGVSAVCFDSATASGMQLTSRIDEPYRKLLRKWGGSYDASWLDALFGQVSQLPRLEQQRDAMRAEVWRLTTQLNSALRREQSLHARLEKISSDLHAVFRSRSWRVMEGPRRMVEKLRDIRQRWFAPSVHLWARLGFPNHYIWWIATHDTITASRQKEMLAEIAGWTICPVISIAMPVYNPPVKFLREAVDSVRAQIYPQWELCIADDASTNPEVRAVLDEYSRRDPRIRVTYRPENGHIVAASNSALAMARGDFVALLDHDDLLPTHALFEVARAVRNHPEAGVIYSDEDKISKSGERFSPYFKPDYNYELLLGQNMISHLGAYRRTLLEEIGGFRAGMEGSQDHDLVLRCIERIKPAQVIHIPRILYHWRVHDESTAGSVDNKPYALNAGIRAINEHFDRVCPGASAQLHPETDYCYRVHFPLPSPAPSVSIIIHARDTQALLGVCLNPLMQVTRYSDFEVFVIDSGAAGPAALDYLDALGLPGKISVLRYDGQFSRAALVNRAVAQSAGEYVLLLDNAIEVIEPDWLAEMVSTAARPGVGAVGARLWRPDKTLQHGGMIGGLCGVAGHAHLGVAAGNPGYFARAVLLQSFSAVTGACLLVRRAIFDEVGGLDAINFTVAFDDVDFCWRVMRAGYRNLWTPYAQLVLHEAAGRSEGLAPEKAERFESEVRYMKEKWGDLLARDPAFNVNLSPNDPALALDYSPPRHQSQPQDLESPARH